MVPRLSPDKKTTTVAGGAKLYAPAFFRDEDDFVAALKLGRSDAQTELVRRHLDRVESVLYRVLGADIDIEDLVQEVFVKAMLGARGFRGTSENLEAWVLQIAVFSARALIRQRTQWRRFFTSSPPPENALPTLAPNDEQRDALRRTYAIFDKLPSDERIALALAWIDEMALPQIAASCNVSRSTIKRRLQKARKRFETLIGLDPILRDLWERGSA